MRYIERHGIENHPPKQLSETPHLHETAKISKSYLGAYTDVGPHCSMHESSMDAYSYLAGHVNMVWTTVGRFCSIAAYTRINPGNHPTWRVTTSHCTYRRRQYGLDTVDDEEFFQWRKDHPCTIGHDVWIGHNVTILAGVSIGIGACIGAGAVVSKNIPPFAIAVGVPAKVIRFRFDQTNVDRILGTEYWNWDRETLVENFADLRDVDRFLERHGLDNLANA